jgi:hypothetical protein
MISLAESWPAKLSSGEAQRLLDEVELRLIEPDELKRWEEEIESHHYLHDARMVGQTLRYVAIHDGRWVGLIGMASASYHLRCRDQWIGWSEPQRRQRLLFVVQNARFLILPGPQAPNLASRLLGLCARRVSGDFEHLHGHGVLLLESFVDYQRYEGTCYRAAGWERLGRTCGFGRAGRDFYTEHGSPKELWIKPLHPQCAEILRQDPLPESWAQQASKLPRHNDLRTAELQSLFDLYGQLPDERGPLPNSPPQWRSSHGQSPQPRHQPRFPRPSRPPTKARQPSSLTTPFRFRNAESGPAHPKKTMKQPWQINPRGLFLS